MYLEKLHFRGKANLERLRFEGEPNQEKSGNALQARKFNRAIRALGLGPSKIIDLRESCSKSALSRIREFRDVLGCWA